MSTKAKEKSYADNDGNTYRIEQATNPCVLPPAAPAGREQRVVGGPND